MSAAAAADVFSLTPSLAEVLNVIDVIKLMIVCFTTMMVVLPVAFLVAFSLPHNNEFRGLCLRVGYWACALAAVCYFAMPTDLIPDIFFPVGFADDLLALGLGYVSVRRALRPANDATLRN